MLEDYHRRRKYIGNELKYVKEFLRNTRRPWTFELERAFGDKFGVKYAISHNSGTSALHSCLAACGVDAGDEVISPGLTVIMDAFAVIYQNAVPVFADIKLETFNIDPNDIREKITERTKAIIVVHLYGLPADMDPIMDIADKHGLIVIEDCAQCVLGVYKGRIAGTIGHMGCFSFERAKHFAIGEGGMVITNDETLAQRVRKFAGIGYKNLTANQGKMHIVPRVFQDPDYKRHDTLGFNYRMPEICAAVGLAQLEIVDQRVKERQAVAWLFDEAIDGCEWMIPQKNLAGVVNSYYAYALRYEGQQALGVPWKTFYDKHIEIGGDGFYGAYSVPYREPAIEKMYLYADGVCPAAEAIQPKLMQFKTNYRDMELAKQKTQALRKTIKALGG